MRWESRVEEQSKHSKNDNIENSRSSVCASGIDGAEMLLRIETLQFQVSRLAGGIKVVRLRGQAVIIDVMFGDAGVLEMVGLAASTTHWRTRPPDVKDGLNHPEKSAERHKSHEEQRGLPNEDDRQQFPMGSSD